MIKRLNLSHVPLKKEKNEMFCSCQELLGIPQDLEKSVHLGQTKCILR